MNPYIVEACCDICGGPGVSTMCTAADRWLGSEIRHTDPAVCAEYLKRRKRELDKKEASLRSEK